MERKRVMLVDDHPMWIDALSEDLVEDGFEIVAVAKNGTECLARARATRPEVVVMDLQIPEPDGATCIEILLGEFPDMHVLVMSASGERDDVLRAMKAGAKGYLVKSASKEEPRGRGAGRPLVMRCSPPASRVSCWESSGGQRGCGPTTRRAPCSPRVKSRFCAVSRRGWRTGRSRRSCSSPTARCRTTCRTSCASFNSTTGWS